MCDKSFLDSVIHVFKFLTSWLHVTVQYLTCSSSSTADSLFLSSVSCSAAVSFLRAMIAACCRNGANLSSVGLFVARWRSTNWLTSLFTAWIYIKYTNIIHSRNQGGGEEAENMGVTEKELLVQPNYQDDISHIMLSIKLQIFSETSI